MARFLARCLGRADSIASRTGSANMPAVGTAGTWNLRAEATAYAEPRTDQSRLRLGFQRLTDSGGKFDGGLTTTGAPLILCDLSETQVDVLLGLSPAERRAIAQAVSTILNAAMPHARRTPLGEVA